MTENREQKRVNHRLIWLGWIAALLLSFAVVVAVFLSALAILQMNSAW